MKDHLYPQLFTEQALLRSDRIAVTDRNGERATTYRELDELSDRVAFTLSGKGIVPGSYIAVRMSRRMEYVAAVLGILKNGCAFVPLLPSYPEERVRQICAECGSAYTITDSFFDVLPAEYEKVILPEDLDAGNAPAYLLFTSGTTGKPKGIVHTMNGFTGVICLQRGLMGDADYSRTAMAEFSFVASTSEIFVSLLDGATVHLVDEKTRMSLPGFSGFIRKTAVCGTFMTASLLKVLRNFSVLPKTVFLGGEPFPAVDESLFERTAFFNVYGQSETLGIAATHRVAPGEYPVPVGKAVPGLELVLLREDGTPAGKGENGEICFIGPYGVSYLNDPALTEAKFKQLPDGRQMIHTGDQGRIDENGDLFYVSRMDSIVKVNGMRVDTQGVEARIAAVPGVEQAIVKAIVNHAGNTSLAAYYLSPSGLSGEEIRKAVSETLPDYMIPQWIVRLPSFPLNASGKVDRNALPDPTVPNAVVYEAPADPTEEKLCRIFEKRLGCRKVGRNDPLQELGGDSLAYMEIIADIEKEFHVQADPSTLQGASTPRALARILDGGRKTEAPSAPVSTFNVLVALAMFALPFVHFAGEFAACGMASGPFLRFTEILELAASPAVFMLMLGNKLSSGERKAANLLGSGLHFLKLALIFDAFRYLLPGLIMLLFRGSDDELFIYFAGSDIYMFVALFYIAFGLIRKLTRSEIAAAAVPLGLLVIFYLVSGRWDGQDYLTGTLAGNFVYTGEYSFFPLFGWMVIPMLGYFCGRYIRQRPGEKEQRTRRIGIMSACLLAVCAALIISGVARIRDSYLSSVPELLIHPALAGVIVCFCRLPDSCRVARWLDRTGTLIMPYYMIHYVIIMFIEVLLRLLTKDGFMVSPPLYIALSITVCAVSLLLTKKKGVRLMQKLL
ncbi:MAG: AMP-binding protein [Clostridia bacterium]|nr:AMP-binding protein [Clostridia bacterium]